MITTVSTGTILNNFAQTVIQGFSMPYLLKTGRRAVLFNPPMGVNSALRSAHGGAREHAQKKRVRALLRASWESIAGGYDE